MNVYDFKVLSQKGEEVSLDIYKGKVLLIVNTATKCGFTPQYEALEAMYEELHDKGFVGLVELLDMNDIDNTLIEETVRYKNMGINVFNSRKFNFLLEKIK
jgi:hypothetical protein